MVNRMKSILTELTFSSSRYCHGFYRSLGDCCRFIEYIRCHLASYQVIKVLVTRKYLSQLFEVKKNMNTWQNKLELEIFMVINKFGRGCLPKLNSTHNDGSLAIMVKFVVRFLAMIVARKQHDYQSKIPSPPHI